MVYFIQSSNFDSFTKTNHYTFSIWKDELEPYTNNNYWVSKSLGGQCRYNNWRRSKRRSKLQDLSKESSSSWEWRPCYCTKLVDSYILISLVTWKRIYFDFNNTNLRRGANNRAISDKNQGLHFSNRSVTVIAQYTGHGFINSLEMFR